MLTLGLRTTSASSTAVRSETPCCKPILPISSRLVQPNNLTLASPAGVHDLFGMTKVVGAVDGQSTDVERAHGSLALASL